MRKLLMVPALMLAIPVMGQQTAFGESWVLPRMLSQSLSPLGDIAAEGIKGGQCPKLAADQGGLIHR